MGKGSTSEQINLSVKEVFQKVPPGISNWSAKFRKWVRKELSKSIGKKFLYNLVNRQILFLILKTEGSWLQRFLRAARISDADMIIAFEEMEMRLKNKSPALQTWKGTFVEVLFVKTRKFRALEAAAIDSSLYSMIWELMTEGFSFFRSGQKLANRNKLGKLLGESLNHDQIPWLAGKEAEALTMINKIKKAIDKFIEIRDSNTKNSAVKTRELALAQSILDNRINALVKLIDPKSIEVALDMAIGGELFVDRAVILTLKSGERLLLVSTEFKNYFLRGAKKQQAKRNARLFEANPNTQITFNTEIRSPEGKLIGFESQKLSAKDFMLNAGTESNDRVLVNLSKELKEKMGANSKPDVQFDCVPITLNSKEVRSALGVSEKISESKKQQVNTNVVQVQFELEMGIEILLGKIFAAFIE